MPRTEQDVIDVVRIAARHRVPVTARGGGTSCAGNAVGAGIVLDFSRHMNRILSIDPVAGTAVVQPGVVLSELQAAVAAYGLRFGPDPSTANRCTIGGMIGNNACGPHGLSYGRTADNIVQMRWLRADGTVIDAGSGEGALSVVPGLSEFVAKHLAVLRTEFGRFDRQISGYSLEHLLPERNSNLAATLAGTEGTVGLILTATVKLVPKPIAPMLVVLGYPDMPSAADDVPALLPFRPLALEGLDAQLVAVIREAKGIDAALEFPRGGGWLMIEVGGASEAEAARSAEAIVSASSCIDSRTYRAGRTASRLWQIRADGAGLAGRTASGEQAWPGWEDSAVPPEHLGDYLRALNSLMASENLSGLAYGHFGDGCVHLRIDFPLEADASVFRRFMTHAAELVAMYGGSLSGEHGDGRARSEFLPVIYSEEALQAMTEFKSLLDPGSILNPGVIVQAQAVDAFLRRPQARTLSASDGFRFDSDDSDITKAIHRCVGVGKCRADNRATGGFMCPSYTATRRETDSTRGRARVLQEMLNGSLIDRQFRSPEVHEALDLCLSCKACATDCPTGIDMATFKSEVLHQSYRGRIRPLTHYTLGRLPQWLRLIAPFARLVNVAGRTPPAERVMLRLIGADPRRSLPSLPPRPFHRTTEARQMLAQSRLAGSRVEHVGGGDVDSSVAARPKVTLWVDSFTDSITPRIAVDAIRVLRYAGAEVHLAEPGACCALTLISTGQLTAARDRLRRTVATLLPAVRAGRVIVGLEPSCTATLRSDLVGLLGDEAGAREVSGAVRTIAEFLNGTDWNPPRVDEELLAQPHCHHYAVMGYHEDQQLLERMGCDTEISAGCCGLAGNFGMEKGHYEVSKRIAEQGVLALAAAAPARGILADGFSCRTQISDLAGLRGRHIVEVIADGLKKEGR
ncbi:MAG: FAD-binding protein [Actinomycetales bacterium]|nr:FAD-binding protein [Actinomycetales bacterium]